VSGRSGRGWPISSAPILTARLIAGYSMGGYAAYKLGLSYPEVFAQAVVLAGPPTSGVRLLPDIDIPADLDPDSHCARGGDSWRLLVNGRWLPFEIAHGLVDEFVAPDWRCSPHRRSPLRPTPPRR
jgi:pimeloyl-ACP methyl ester carboxylesterase